jgi:hypothetical protein
VRAATAGRNHVFVQAGVYNEVVVLVNGVNIWGGYNFGWQRASYATPGHRVEIVGRQDTAAGGDGEYLAVRAHDLIVPVTLGDLVITGPDAAGDVGGDGRSSYAVHVDSATVRLERVAINGGRRRRGHAWDAGHQRGRGRRHRRHERHPRRRWAAIHNYLRFEWPWCGGPSRYEYL